MRACRAVKPKGCVERLRQQHSSAYINRKRISSTDSFFGFPLNQQECRRWTVACSLNESGPTDPIDEGSASEDEEPGSDKSPKPEEPTDDAFAALDDIVAGIVLRTMGAY